MSYVIFSGSSLGICYNTCTNSAKSTGYLLASLGIPSAVVLAFVDTRLAFLVFFLTALAFFLTQLAGSLIGEKVFLTSEKATICIVASYGLLLTSISLFSMIAVLATIVSTALLIAASAVYTRRLSRT